MIEKGEFPKSVQTVSLWDIGGSYLSSLLSSFSSLNLGVIGDCGIDAFWHADMEKAQLSYQTPLFVRPIYEQSYSLAMAGNVARNFVRLGVEKVHIISVLGNDWQGRLTRIQLEQEKIDCHCLIGSDKFVTPMLSRVFLHSLNATQEDARIDFINFEELSSDDEETLINSSEKMFQVLDGVAIIDNMQSSVLSRGVIDFLNSYTKKHTTKFVVDSHYRISNYNNMTLKMNWAEAITYLNEKLSLGIYTLSDLFEQFGKIQERIDQSLIITLGALGCIIINRDRIYSIPAISLENDVNTLGAGDAFQVGYLCALSKGASEVESAIVGNLVAGVSCKKNKVEAGFATPQDIISLFNSKDQTL
jgi:bifunctional ADP-heptose synthase (sugar kinase/adenylyltransferase)